MALLDDLAKYGITLRQDRGRLFYEEAGQYGQTAGSGEIMDLSGFDLSQIPTSGISAYDTSKSNFGDINVLLDRYKLLEANKLASEKAIADATASNLAGGFYTGAPQIGTPEQMAQLEQSGTEARNALLPTGVQPGESFGQPLQPYTDPNASGSIYTPPGTGNANNTVYKDLQGNIFKLDGTPIDQETFQDMGLNVSQINTKQQLDSRTGGQQEAENAFIGGGVTSGRLPGEQTDFMDSLKSTNPLVNRMMSLFVPSAGESQIQQQLNRLLDQEAQQQLSYQAGSNKLGQEVIPMPLILGGQRALLEQQAIAEQGATNQITSLQRQLQLMQGDREGQLKAMEFAYQVNQDNVAQQMELFKMSQPEKLAMDESKGLVYFMNPISKEVTVSKLPGWTPSGGDLKYVDLGNRVAMLDASGNEVGSLPKGMTPSQVGLDGTLNSKEQQMFLQITNKFQADSVMQQAGSGQIIRGIAGQVIANPDSAPNQLKSLYVLVKNLDPDSAVREGELALANSTQSYLQQFGNSLARINEGRVIDPQAAVDLANATLDIVTLWEQAAQRRKQQYQSQASTVSSNVGSSFSSYLGGFDLQNTGKSNAETDIQETIKANLSTNREDLIKSLVPVFPEFTLDEIAKYVYTIIQDK